MKIKSRIIIIIVIVILLIAGTNMISKYYNNQQQKEEFTRIETLNERGLNYIKTTIIPIIEQNNIDDYRKLWVKIPDTVSPNPEFLNDLKYSNIEKISLLTSLSNEMEYYSLIRFKDANQKDVYYSVLLLCTNENDFWEIQAAHFSNSLEDAPIYYASNSIYGKP